MAKFGFQTGVTLIPPLDEEKKSMIKQNGTFPQVAE